MTKTTNSVMSSEEAELARIATLRKELAQKRKKAQNSYKKVQSSTGYMPMRATIEVTQPAEFHFQTDERVKSHASETSQEQVKPEDFVKNLRRSDPTSVSARSKIKNKWEGFAKSLAPYMLKKRFWDTL